MRRSVGVGTGRKRAALQPTMCHVCGSCNAKNTVAGQWRAHGRNVARERVTHDGDKAIGFDGRRESIAAAANLGTVRNWMLPSLSVGRCINTAMHLSIGSLSAMPKRLKMGSPYSSWRVMGTREYPSNLLKERPFLIV